MDHGDVLSGVAFKAVLRAALVFLVVLAAMAVVSVGLIDRMLTDELKLWIEGMERSVTQIAEEQGETAVPPYVDATSRGPSGATMAYAVFDRTGTRLTGNVDVRPVPGTWVEVTVGPEAAPDLPAPRRYLIRAVEIEGLTVVIGRSMGAVSAARMTAIWGFALTGFVVVVVMLAIGYLLSRKSQRKLEHIEAVLDSVSHGQTSARIASSEGDDQIERIAARINTHLDQLDTLFQQTRRTAASVAHDLRRPLARATLGMERALAQVEAGEDARERIEHSLADLTHLTSVIEAILRIARIESGNIGEMAPFDLRDLLDEIAETFQPVAEDAAQRLDYARADQPLIVKGDPEMLAQLVVNLVQNAITHAGAGARITLGAGPAPGPETGRGGVCLTVADTGPGIPETVRNDVFEPFFRIDTARTIEGSGLGLALVKAIADRHGASVRLEDGAPGLRVRVTFPKLANS